MKQIFDPGVLLNHLRQTLSSERFRHVMSVARWARVLAVLHGASPEKAWRAGLLHDLAKEMPGPSLARYVVKHRLSVPGRSDIFRHKQFGLLHAPVSAHRAKTEWGEQDPEVLSAVARHTLGHPRMSRLDTLLYVADFSSPDRRYAAARTIRDWARKDLPRALRGVVAWKIRTVVEQGGFLHPVTTDLWNRLAEGKK
jgi:predicted HD superfamily hydrolase involved in NAD metabolism